MIRTGVGDKRGKECCVAKQPELLAILFIDRDGRQHYMRDSRHLGEGPITAFRSREIADVAAQFWRDSLGDAVLSVNVVPFPDER